MTKAIALPSQERLKELFDYDPDTGVCIWTAAAGKRRIGKEVGSLQKQKGYLMVDVDGKKYQVHRLIWVHHYGSDPSEKQVDHINGVRSDNRIENIRLVTNQQNLRNMRPRNKLGLKGVTQMGEKFCARIYPNNKQIILGYFNTAEEAAEAYKKAAKELYKEYAYSH